MAAEPTGSYGYLIPFGGFTIFDANLRFPRAPLADDCNPGGRLGWPYPPGLAVEGAPRELLEVADRIIGPPGTGGLAKLLDEL